MLDQKIFGEKLRNHRKLRGMTQEAVAEKIGVTPQAISKWESGDCLPDCFNLKALSDVYELSADVLLETSSSGDIDAVANKIEQLGTEFVWANADAQRYRKNAHKELGADLWKMWKGLYFVEVGDRQLQKEDEEKGNTRILGAFGTKIWDDDGVACVIRSDLVKNRPTPAANTVALMTELCQADGQALIAALPCTTPISKQELLEQTQLPLPRLNELLLLFIENNIAVFIDNTHAGRSGYMLSGHCGIAAYMTAAAMHILEKRRYTVSQYMFSEEE